MSSNYLPAVIELKRELQTAKQKYEMITSMSEKIVVVAGQYDQAQDVLSDMGKEMGVRYTVADSYELPFLQPSQLLIVNCGVQFSNKQIHRIRDFAAYGGWLLTTDWCLKEVIEPAFPGALVYLGQTRDDVVKIEPVENQVTKGIKPLSEFWLENASYTFQVVNQRGVSVLIKSNELNRKYGSPNVLACWNWYDGMVFHQISHIALQKSRSGKLETRDAFSSLCVLTNIIAQKGRKNQ